jgi:leader peptidase (prepilin peptidase)/N-methyltransferase
VETAETILLAMVGIFVGAAIWNVARSQAANRPLFGTPICTGCEARSHPTGWLPFYGIGLARHCKNCGVHQHWVRLAFELGVGAYFAILAMSHDWGLDLAASLLFAVPLLVILLVDWWTRLIYTNVIGVGLMLGLVIALIDGPWQLVNSLLSMVGSAAAFGLLFVMAALIYRNISVVPFGLGDVYLAAMIGAMVRYPAVVSALFLGVLLAGVVLALLLASKRVSRQTAVPYGPFLCAGALVSLVLGP